MKTRFIEKRFDSMESARAYAEHVNKDLRRKAASVYELEWLVPTGHGFETRHCFAVGFKTRSAKF